jgi:hypothetical protein
MTQCKWHTIKRIKAHSGKKLIKSMKVWTYHITPTSTVDNIVEKLLSKSWWSTCNIL